MPTGTCPECDADVHVDTDADKGDVVSCEECGTELEVVGLDPVELDIVEEDYEQCSDHITEKMPSSTRFGSRPSSSLTRVNSSGVRLCAAMTSAVIDSINSRQKAESSRQKNWTPSSLPVLLPTAYCFTA